MSANDIFIALDTSAYTTSVSGYTDRIAFDERKTICVPKGGLGLRQSAAVFEHIKNLDLIFLNNPAVNKRIKAVAYSAKPCPKEKSYMPVFNVGASHARAIAFAAAAKLFELTHQHAHIYCSFLNNCVNDGYYGALHVSGGTLDVLRIFITGGIIQHIEQIGGALDITCGQLIDRVGVKAGLPFPAGQQAEKLYCKTTSTLSAHVKGLGANLSGAETQAVRRLEAGEDRAEVLSDVIDCVANTIVSLTENAAKTFGLGQFIFTGGVMRNGIIRERIKERCSKIGVNCILTHKNYCSDNACGLAYAAWLHCSKGE